MTKRGSSEPRRCSRVRRQQKTLFDIANVIALIGWALLILLPRREGVLHVVLYGAVGLLCACYLVMLVSLVGNLVDPMPAAGAPPAPDFEYSVQGLMAMFRSEGAIVVGWTHYLALDLMTGLWIMAGPAGLFGWLVARAFLRGDTDGAG